jgi:hypothetical protein
MLIIQLKKGFTNRQESGLVIFILTKAKYKKLYLSQKTKNGLSRAKT